ncbi:dioxygenase [Microbacterium sp. P06]|uniref:dioxygenase n=1 Tax=Microbacterium sp. P06 TaxID=3366949 RepID=UPI00374612CD
MATGGKDRGSRAARERARIYQARQELHASEKRRRTRDNLVASIAGGVIVLAAIGAQVVYFSSGPGVPEPAASVEPAPTATSEPTVAPEPETTAPAVAPTP